MQSSKLIICPSLQVETTNRVTSLASKPVLPNSIPQENELSAGQNTGGSSSSGLTTPRKRSSIQGTDRQTFHKLFQAALKSNQLSSEGGAGAGGGGGGGGGGAAGGAAGVYRTASPSPQQQEREVYQNERGDVIWLELQVRQEFITKIPRETQS